MENLRDKLNQWASKKKKKNDKEWLHCFHNDFPGKDPSQPAFHHFSARACTASVCVCHTDLRSRWLLQPRRFSFLIVTPRKSSLEANFCYATVHLVSIAYFIIDRLFFCSLYVKICVVMLLCVWFAF